MRIADIYLADKLAPAPPAPTPVELNAVKVDPSIFELMPEYLAEGLGILTILGKAIAHGQPARDPKAELIPQSEPSSTCGKQSRDTFEKTIKARSWGGHANRQPDSHRQKTGCHRRRRLNSWVICRRLLQPRSGHSLYDGGERRSAHRATPRHNDIQLTELDGDLCAGGMWFFQSVRFTRDGQKRIDGFRLTSGRVRNLRFEKMSKTIGSARYE